LCILFLITLDGQAGPFISKSLTSMASVSAFQTRKMRKALFSIDLCYRKMREIFHGVTKRVPSGEGRTVLGYSASSWGV
jgi:hypothetical protein